MIAVESLVALESSAGLALIQQIRLGQGASAPAMPIAVLVESCNVQMLQVLRDCGISRILIKPFRVRDVVDTIGGMRELARGAPGPS